MAALDEKARIRADFDQLQREYRNMEAMRKAYTEESMGIIRKQREMVEKLQSDNERLKSDIELEQRFAQRQAVSDSAITSVNDQIDLFTGKVALERRNVESLRKQIKLLQTKILDQRKMMGGVNAARENDAMIKKQIRILENRLDKALVKFNEALAHNKELREDIDNLRRDRVVFDGVYRKLEDDLRKQKKEMADIIEVSNQAYEARDAAQMEIAAIQQAIGRERAEFEEAIAELDNRIRESAAAAADAAQKRGEMTMEEEARLKEDVSRGAWDLAKDRAEVQLTMEKAASYEAAFNKIKQETNIRDIEELVTKFIQNEDQNFSLFNYVAEQNNERERLEEAVAKLRVEEAKYTLESGEDMTQHKQLLKDLEANLTQKDAAAEKSETRFQIAQKTINSLKVAIESMVRSLECRPQNEMLAEQAVTENNMIQFLGVLEQRSNELLRLYGVVKEHETAAEEAAQSSLQLTDGDAAATFLTSGGIEAPNASQHLVSLLGHGPSTKHGTDKALHVEPPKLDEYSSDDEDSEEEGEARPLTMKELKDKTERTLHAKQTGVAAGGRRR